jgi:hypothetical protein
MATATAERGMKQSGQPGIDFFCVVAQIDVELEK